jgi:ribosomal protein S18 acetylase RimI-like enzyme
MFKIVPFAAEHISKLTALQSLCETEIGWNPPQEYLEEWTKAVIGIHRQDHNLIKVAFDDNNIVGYCISVKKLHDYEGVVMDITWKTAYIWDLFVCKEYRNRGIGTALLQDAFTYLKSIGFDKVGLLVNCGNEDARKLYEKQGFKLYSQFFLKSL